MTEQHRLLMRQLRRAFPDGTPETPEFLSFLEAVREAYESFDRERALIERALELSSEELLAANSEIRSLLTREQQARAEAEMLATRARLLSEAATILTRSLEPKQTLPGVAGLLVRRFADWCAIDLITATGPTRIVETASADLDGVAVLPSDHPVIARSMRSAEERLIDASTAESMGLDQRVGSVIVTPLLGQDATLGLLSLGTSSHRAFDESEVEWARDLAQRIVLAVENARLYQESQELSRAKDSFLASLSHELRTPMTAILGWARMLRHEDLEPEAIREAIDAIERSATVQARLTEDLLDISRIVAGKLHLDVKSVVMQEIIRAAIETQQSAISEKEIAIELNLPSSPVVVEGDPNRLQQVVWNILSNAVKFTPQGGHVSIALRIHKRQAELEIRDDGEGIPPEFLPEIFGRFRQAESSSRRIHGGLGLGLAIVHHLVQLHGGSVTAESEGQGRGATFRVVLPARLTESPDVPAPRRGSVATKLRGRRLLVVDDAGDSRSLIRAVLERAGASVLDADSVSAALPLIDAGQFDLIVSDIAMPEADGFDFLRAIRERGHDMPVIALTAFGRPEDRERILGAGFALHLVKPIDPSLLTEELSRICPGELEKA